MTASIGSAMRVRVGTAVASVIVTSVMPATVAADAMAATTSVAEVMLLVQAMPDSRWGRPGRASAATASAIADSSRPVAVASVNAIASAAPPPTGRPTVRDTSHTPAISTLTASDAMWGERRELRSSHIAAPSCAQAATRKPAPSTADSCTWTGITTKWMAAEPTLATAATLASTPRHATGERSSPGASGGWSSVERWLIGRLPRAVRSRREVVLFIRAAPGCPARRAAAS